MSNNRLYLKHTPTGKQILLAKYFPEQGWYTFHSQEKLDKWFEQFIDGSLFGDIDFEIEPEIIEHWHDRLRIRTKFKWRRLKRKLGFAP